MSFLINPYRFAAAGSSYTVREGFEGTGTPAGWVNSGTTPDFDYTTSPIVGAQSFHLALSAASGNSYVTFTLAGKVYWFARLRLDALPTGSTANLFQYRTTGGTAVATFGVRVDGLITCTATGGTANASTTTAMTTGVNYYVWGTYTPATIAGNDGIAEMGFSTDGTRPAFTASSDRACKSTNGTSTSDAGRFYTGPTASSTVTFTVDDVIVNGTAIGNNP